MTEGLADGFCGDNETMKNLLSILIFGLIFTASAYQPVQVQTYGTIADMVANGSPKAKANGFFSTANVQGYSSPYDGGGGVFTITTNTTGMNTGTLIDSGVSGLAWKRIDQGPMNVKWFGAVGNGSLGDVPLIKAAYDSMKATGGTLFFPPGKYACTLIVTNSGVIISGAGASGDREDFTLGGIGTVLIPGDTNSPVIQFGNDTCYVKNSGVDNVYIQGPGKVGLAYHGGSAQSFNHNVCLYNFVHNMEVFGESNFPCWDIRSFSQDNRVGSMGTNQRGLYIRQPLNGAMNSSFTTACFFMGGSHFFSNSAGYEIEDDGVQLNLGDTYLDGFDSTSTNSHSVLLKRTATTAFLTDPILVDGYLDGGGIQIEVGYTNAIPTYKAVSAYARQTGLVGSLGFPDGTTMAGVGGAGGWGTFGQQYSTMDIYGSLNIRADTYLGGMVYSNSINAQSNNGLTISAGLALTLLPSKIGGTQYGVVVLGDPPTLTGGENVSGFEAWTMVGGHSNVTINPPGGSGGSVAVTGRGFQATAAGAVTVPSTLTVGSFSTFGNDLYSSIPDLAVRVPHEFFSYSGIGMAVVATNTASLYLFDQADGSLTTFSSSTSGGVSVIPAGSLMTINGVLKVAGTSSAISPPKLTKAQRNALTPDDGWTIYQTDNTPGLRVRENGAWVKYTATADP